MHPRVPHRVHHENELGLLDTTFTPSMILNGHNGVGVCIGKATKIAEVEAVRSVVRIAIEKGNGGLRFSHEWTNKVRTPRSLIPSQLNPGQQKPSQKS